MNCHPDDPSTVEAAAQEGGTAADALHRLIRGYWNTQIVRAAADLRIADHVTAGATTAKDIAAREGSDPVTTHRLLRACAALGLLCDEGEGRFATTLTGDLLRSGIPESLRDSALAFGAPGHWLPWGLLPQAVRRGETQVLTALGRDVFDYFGDHPDEAGHFSGAMSAITRRLTDEVVHLVDTTNVSTVVDVGGSNGVLLRGLMLANPALTGRLLDLPHVVDGARDLMGEAGLGERVDVMGGNFFEGVPSADLYVLKAILHDWDDASCELILRNCHASAEPGARVVVVENVIGTPSSTVEGAILDMNMLAISSGQERDLAEFDALFAASGWRRISLHQTSGSRFVMEAVYDG